MQQATCPGKMVEIAGLAAQIILENGAETYRVEDTVVRLCRSYGYDDADVIALSTGVLLSVSIPGDSVSIVRRVRKRGMNLERVNAVNDLSRRIAGGGVPMDEALAALRAISRSAALGPFALAALAGLAAGSFALMFGGGLIPFAIALFCGAVTQLLAYTIRQAEISLVLVPLVGGLLCSAITMVVSLLLPLTPEAVETALAGAIMPLISGLMMTNAVRDTLRGDLLSGMARVVEALLVAVMVALGISLLLGFYLPGGSDAAPPPPPWYLAVAYAGVATLFFCPLLKIPSRAIMPCALLGAAVYAGYLLLMNVVGLSEIYALFLSSAAVAVLCDVLARRMRMITTIFLCAALIPLVPGHGLYRTMRALVLSESMQALSTGLHTLGVVGIIALGAALGSLRIQRPERARGKRK